VQFYAFDVLMSDGDDLRKLPLSMRKANLSRLLARPVNGIFLSDFERGEIGPDLFRHACMLGLEGLVSKRNDRPYRAGVSPNWVKVKNREHPAINGVAFCYVLRRSFTSAVQTRIAGSTGRCNTGVKSLCWCFKLQGLTWSFV